MDKRKYTAPGKFTIMQEFETFRIKCHSIDKYKISSTTQLANWRFALLM
ncbi:hypothetical protein AB4Z29_31055 [Paenibacillus sp. 2TAB23]